MYKNYSDIDFIKDEFFIRWVRTPDKETDLFWQNWLANHPEKRREVEVAREFLKRVKVQDEYSLPDKTFSQLHENILRYNREQRYKEMDTTKHVYFKYVRSLVAIFLLLVISIGALELVKNRSAADEYAITYITKNTIEGVKYTTVLPDGTKVKLNSSSSLRYPEHFADNRREVFLDGEAFFEVVRDEQKPFVVHSGGIKVQVLGTSFNVRDYGDEDETRVALVSGKVRIEPLSESVPSLVLEPNQMAVFNRQSQLLHKSAFDFKTQIGWKEGVLVFSNTTLAEVFDRLERWYGVGINVENDVSLTDIYDGEFSNESLQNVLTAIGFASGFDFTITDKTVKIYQNKKKRL